MAPSNAQVVKALDRVHTRTQRHGEPERGRPTFEGHVRICVDQFGRYTGTLGLIVPVEKFGHNANLTELLAIGAIELVDPVADDIL
jgi:hypothetical protein